MIVIFNYIYENSSTGSFFLSYFFLSRKQALKIQITLLITNCLDDGRKWKGELIFTDFHPRKRGGEKGL